MGESIPALSRGYHMIRTTFVFFSSRTTTFSGNDGPSTFSWCLREGPGCIYSTLYLASMIVRVEGKCRSLVVAILHRSTFCSPYQTYTTYSPSLLNKMNQPQSTQIYTLPGTPSRNPQIKSSTQGMANLLDVPILSLCLRFEPSALPDPSLGVHAKLLFSLDQ